MNNFDSRLPVTTRDGREARIAAWDVEFCDGKRGLLAYYKMNKTGDKHFHLGEFTNDGRYWGVCLSREPDSRDLVNINPPLTAPKQPQGQVGATIPCPACGFPTDQSENSFECHSCRQLWPRGHGWETRWAEDNSQPHPKHNAVKLAIEALETIRLVSCELPIPIHAEFLAQIVIIRQALAALAESSETRAGAELIDATVNFANLYKDESKLNLIEHGNAIYAAMGELIRLAKIYQTDMRNDGGVV